MQTCIIYVYIYCTFIDIPRSSTAPLKFPFFVIFALKEYMNIVSGNFEPYSPEIAYAKEPYATTCISRYSRALSLSLSLLLIQRYLSYLCVLLDCLDLHVMRESQTSQFQLKLANENNINNNNTNK